MIGKERNVVGCVDGGGLRLDNDVNVRSPRRVNGKWLMPLSFSQSRVIGIVSPNLHTLPPALLYYYTSPTILPKYSSEAMEDGRLP